MIVALSGLSSYHFCMIIVRLDHLTGTCIALVLARLMCYHIQCNQGHFLTMSRLNSDSRNQIIGMLQAGLSQHDVAARFNVDVSTISRLNMRFLQTGSAKDRPRSS